MYPMPTQSLLLLLLGLFWALSSPAQELPWRTELEASATQLPSNLPYGGGWHLGLMRQAAQTSFWHRASFDFQHHYLPSFYVTPDQGPALQQDSGMIQRLVFSYGLVRRYAINEHVTFNLGAEAGIAYLWGVRSTRRWESGNITDAPLITRIQSDRLAAVIGPYLGLTVWVLPRMGFRGESWLRMVLDPGNPSGFSLDMQPEVRLGFAWRLTSRRE